MALGSRSTFVPIKNKRSASPPFGLRNAVFETSYNSSRKTVIQSGLHDIYPPVRQIIHKRKVFAERFVVSVMATVDIFMLGATGFIGSAVFDLIYAKHPEYRYAVLVRSETSTSELVLRHPLVRLVIGDMSNTELIESESEKANIVISKASKSLIILIHRHR